MSCMWSGSHTKGTNPSPVFNHRLPNTKLSSCAPADKHVSASRQGLVSREEIPRKPRFEKEGPLKVLCVGNDPQSVEHTRMAIQFRWPDASFTAEPSDRKAIAAIQSQGFDLLVAFQDPAQASVAAFCSEVRGFSDIPLIVIADVEADSAPDLLSEVKALEAGADDYILSTVGLAELVARVVALIRRVQFLGLGVSDEVLQSGDLMLIPATGEVFLGGRKVHLTNTEFKLLHLLMRNPGSAVRHGMVERALWGEDVDGATSVKKYVHRVRRKLSEASDEGYEFIRSVYGIGYSFTGAKSEVEQMQETA